MHKISRVHVANAGYKMAWYDGITLDFTDAGTGGPTHTIFNLVNQGGKTTFLSLFFSTFDTAKDRFLQHLSNKAQRFEHYFDKNGLPGFIIVEWQLPGDLATPTRTLVTGQAVVMRKAGETFEPDRFFFWFSANEALSLNTLLTPKLSSADGQALCSRDQVMHWLHDLRIRHPGGFNDPQRQTDWKQALEREGLDMEMLRHQVDFNRKEGAMDESFLDFKTEYDFTRRFLSLSMNGADADDVRSTVATHCQRFARRKPLESSRLQLERLRDVFSGFAVASRDYIAAEDLRQHAEAQVGVASATLALRAREHMDLSDAQTVFADSQNQAARLYAEERVARQKDAEAYRYEQLRRDEAAAAENLRAAEDQVHEADTRIRLYEAAEVLASLEAKEHEVSLLNQAIEAAHGDIQPLRTDMEQRAAQLHGALNACLRDKSSEADAAKQAASVALRQSELLTEEEARLHQEKSAAERLDAQLQQRIADARRQEELLRREQVIEPGERPDDAQHRLSETVSLLELQLQELDEQASSREQGAQAIQAELIKLSSELAAQNVAASQLEAEALDADHWRDKLRHDGILARAIGAELADPDSEVLPASLARFIHREQSQLLDAELALARLEETASSIRDVGLAGHDPDVSRVVRQLADAGVITAKAYPAYLADVLPEEDAAKAVVMSNPGRFLGVMVPNVAQLQRAQEALLTAPSVSKPVMVSLATRDPEEPQGDRFVVPPENGSLFNKEAAKAFAAKLQDRIDHARGKRDSLRDYLHVARESESALRQYQARLGQGRFALLQDNAQRARAACQALAERKLQAQRQQEQARAEAKELREAEKREARRLASLHTQLRQVRDYLREFESQLTEWQARAAEAQAALARSLEELADLKRRKIELDSIRLHQRDVELALRAEVVELHAEKARLPAVEPMDPGLLPLHALRSGYETAKDSLRKVEEEKTGHLAVQRDSLQREFPGLRIKYQSMAAGLEERRIRAHLGVAYREAIGRENAVCSEARARQAQAATAKGAAGQALDAFRRQRKYPQHAVLGAEDQSDTALAVSYQDSDQRVRRADEAEKAARQQEQAGRDKARDLKQAADTFANQNATLRELVTMVELPAPDPALFRTAQGLGEACARMTRALKEADTRKEKAETNARRAHDKVLRIVTDAEFLKVDADLAVTLKSNPIEAAIRDHARIEHAIEDRMAAVVSELATMEQDFERATEALHGLASTAITLLRRAAEDMRLPDNVPVVGGLTVVKMSRALFTLTHEARRARLRPYMEELAADGNIPESGAALATQAVLRLADGRLGIRILKMVDVADEQYVPVDGLSHSGAERISMALLLYFVIAKLRYEARAKTRKAQGGVLMLDNPFAKATARPIWQAILSLADTMDVQLVIATGIKEYDTLSVFRRFLRLAKTERNATTGRTHVSVADFNFRPNMNTEAA